MDYIGVDTYIDFTDIFTFSKYPDKWSEGKYCNALTSFPVNFCVALISSFIFTIPFIDLEKSYVIFEIVSCTCY